MRERLTKYVDEVLSKWIKTKSKTRRKIQPEKLVNVTDNMPGANVQRKGKPTENVTL